MYHNIVGGFTAKNFRRCVLAILPLGEERSIERVPTSTLALKNMFFFYD